MMIQQRPDDEIPQGDCRHLYALSWLAAVTCLRVHFDGFAIPAISQCQSSLLLDHCSDVLPLHPGSSSLFTQYGVCLTGL